MSISDSHATNAKPGTAIINSVLSSEDAEYMRQADAIIDCMGRSIPEAPYIITVPSEPRYQHYSRQQSEAWRKDTYFDPSEEHLQYMSFLYREHGDSCFHMRTEVDEERERQRMLRAKGILPAKPTASPATAPVKKITLAAYTSKMVNGSAGKTTANPAGGEKDGNTAGATVAPKLLEQNAPPLQTRRKRPSPEGMDTNIANRPVHIDGAPNTKKKHGSQPSTVAATSGGRAKPSVSTPHNLPPMLSPTLLPTDVSAQSSAAKQGLTTNERPRPSRQPSSTKPSINSTEASNRTSQLSNSKTSIASDETSNHAGHPLNALKGVSSPNMGPHGLPPMLSPTLPANIEEELARQRAQQKPTVASTPSSAEKRTTSSISKQQANSPSMTTDSIGSRSQKLDADLKSAARPGTKKVIEPPRSALRSVDDKSGKADGEGNSSIASNRLAVKPIASIERESNLLTKLRYGRKNRIAVERYLRLPPSKSLDARKTTEAEGRSEKEKSKDGLASSKMGRNIDSTRKVDSMSKREAAAKEVHKRADNAKLAENKMRPTAEKRPRLEDDAQSSAPASKRTKVQPTLDNQAHTPVQQTATSPALSSRSSAQRAPQPTPRRDPKAISMKRTVSTDGSNATPHETGSTPAESGSIEHPKDGPTSTPAKARAGSLSEAQQWNHLSREYNDLGRRLKHSAQKVNVTEKTQDARKLGAVLNSECILSYMAAYHCVNYYTHLEQKPVADVDQNWRTLLPLVEFVRSQCRLIPDLEALCLILGGVVCSRILFLTSKRIQNGDADPTALAAHAGRFLQMQHYFSSAREIKSIENWKEDYPQAYEGQSKKYSHQSSSGFERHGLCDLGGSYYLHFGSETTPVQAIRAGLAILEEYIEKEALDYTLQLKLKLSA